MERKNTYDSRSYNCAGCAFETYGWEEFSCWNLNTFEIMHEDCIGWYRSNHKSLAKEGISFLQVQKQFEDDLDKLLAEEAACKFGKKLSVYSGEKDYPIGTILMRCMHNATESDYHFVRRIEIAGEKCWLSKAGELDEDILLDSQIFSANWPGDYDRTIYVLS